MKNVIILGSTGSIGTQTLEVIEKLDGYNVLALACGNNIELLKKQIAKFNPKIVCIDKSENIKDIKHDYANLKVLSGKEGLLAFFVQLAETFHGFVVIAVLTCHVTIRGTRLVFDLAVVLVARTGVSGVHLFVVVEVAVNLLVRAGMGVDARRTGVQKVNAHWFCSPSVESVCKRDS